MSLRALVVSHAYPRISNPWHGLFVHRWNQGLLRAGIDVEVLQLSHWSPPWPLSALDSAWREAHAFRRDLRDELDEIPIHHPRVFHPRPSRLFVRDPWEMESQALVSYSQRDRRLRTADVVIGHFLVPDGYHALQLGRALQRPVIGVAWGDDVHAWPERLPGWRERLTSVLDGIDIPVACSRRLAEDANIWMARPRDDWEVIYAGIDLDRFRAPQNRVDMKRQVFGESVPANAKVLLMVGQRVIAKGYIELLDAWQRLEAAAPDWHLVMAGVNRGDVDVIGESARRRLTRTHWVGEVADLASMLQASDGFVLPSHNEGLSLSVVEALATGLPVVTTDVGGHVEVLRSAAEGWLIPPRDVDALATALQALIALSAEERAARAVTARGAAEQFGSALHNAARLAELVRRVAERGRTAPAPSPRSSSTNRTRKSPARSV